LYVYFFVLTGNTMMNNENAASNQLSPLMPVNLAGSRRDQSTTLVESRFAPASSQVYAGMERSDPVIGTRILF